MAQVRSGWVLAYRVSKNPIILFTFSRYLGYAMQFVRGILVAKFLGPYFFGIWGFSMLVNQYLAYTSFGMQHAINVELAVNAVSDSSKQKKNIGVAFSVAFLIAIILFVTGLTTWFYDVPLFKKYNFSQYVLFISLVVGLTHPKEILTNVYRVYGKLGRIMISELLFAFIPLMTVLFFRGETLIFALLISMALSNLVILIIYVVKAPFPITFQLDLATIKHLLTIGVPLLVYNFSFDLIMLAGRTIISVFYTVEMMGFFALATNITNATLLGLRAVTWVVFPSILSRTRLGLLDNEVTKTIKKVNDLYSTSVFLVVFGVILLTPFLFLVLPQYKPAFNILSLLLLAQAVLSVPFAYSTMLIARNQQLKMAGISIVAMGFVIMVGGFAAWMQWNVMWIAVSMLVSGFVYSILQTRFASRLLNHGEPQPGYLIEILPVGSMVAMAFFFVGSFINYQSLLGSVGLMIFVVTRRRSIGRLWSFVVDRA